MYSIISHEFSAQYSNLFWQPYWSRVLGGAVVVPSVIYQQAD
jgi:hypothetical protein